MSHERSPPPLLLTLTRVAPRMGELLLEEPPGGEEKAAWSPGSPGDAEARAVVAWDQLA